jgi:hypothetical protein
MGNLLGSDTPSIDDWKNVPEDAFPGITLAIPSGSGSSQLYVTKIDGAPLTGFPDEVNLPELTLVSLRDQTGLSGKMLPAGAGWNTPKCSYLSLAFTGMTGPVPQGIANIPVLNQLYIDGCDFYGALPHIWASENIQIVIANNGNTRLGYLLPARLDVTLNFYDGSGNLINECNDKTQMKFAGNNWTGFEKGWGQDRYEKYDGNAVAGDKTIWSEHRLLLDDWAWYFSDLGMIPATLSDWNQQDADAYTAMCR